MHAVAQQVIVKPYINYANIQPVEFDPSNEDHRNAYRMMREEGRQHPNFRFHVEHPYEDVVTVMEKKLSLFAVKEFKG